MKVLVLCKRRSTGKDALAERFGRLYELPEGLAAQGDDVRAFALGYRREAALVDPPSARVRWTIGHASIRALRAHVRAIEDALVSDRPDVIWASSDMPHAAFGAWLGRRHRVPVVVDLYDDYEAFGLTRLPGGRGALRAACRASAGVTVVSATLAEKVARDYGAGPVAIVANGARTDLFHPRDRDEAREALGLPIAARLVGTVGALEASRGIDDLWRAFLLLAETDPLVHLVVAGPRDAGVRRWRHPRLHWLGELPLPRAALAVSALDVAVVCNRDTPFGRACHPLKFVEAVAADRPVVAARVGDTARWLEGFPDSGYLAGDAADLAEKIRRQLASPRRLTHVPATDWAEQARHLSDFLRRVVSRD